MLDHYIINDIRQIKALSHSTRVKILSCLAEKPMTAKQLADMFGEEPAKTSYHVKQLLKVGLVQLVYTRETQNGIVEKYYRAIAREFQADPYLTPQTETKEPGENGLLRQLSRARADFLRASRRRQEGESKDPVSCGFESVQLSADDVPAFEADLRSLLSRYDRKVAGQAYAFHYLVFPRQPDDQD